MRAVVMNRGKLFVQDCDEPTPEAGEVLVETLACGICGSDLHALEHTDDFVTSVAVGGGAPDFTASDDVVLGHELSARVLDYGPHTQRQWPVGTIVTSPPFLIRSDGFVSVGYSQKLPGGFAQRMVLQEFLVNVAPPELSAELVALTEPLAIGVHAVQQARLRSHDVPLVIGCGPVGLAVILALRKAGVRPIIASDFSAKRRELAIALGADEVVDPALSSPYTRFEELAKTNDPALAGDMFAPLFKRPMTRPLVVFECVGVPGVLANIVAGVPRFARIMVVGVCVQEDRFRPQAAVAKQLEMHFVLGYSREEFAATLAALDPAQGLTDALITSRVTLDEVAGAFDLLKQPDTQVKIMVLPQDG